MNKKTKLAFLLAALTPAVAGQTEPMRIAGTLPVDEAVNRLAALVEDAGAKMFLVIEFAQGNALFEAELCQTKSVLLGSPKIGATALQDARKMARHGKATWIRQRRHLPMVMLRIIRPWRVRRAHCHTWPTRPRASNFAYSGRTCSTSAWSSSATISATVRPKTGCTQSGATSARGIRTKARSCKRGCGRIRRSGATVIC